MTTIRELRLVRALVLTHVAAREEVEAADAAWNKAFKDGQCSVDHETRETMYVRLDTANIRLAVLDEVYAAALADDAKEAP